MSPVAHLWSSCQPRWTFGLGPLNLWKSIEIPSCCVGLLIVAWCSSTTSSVKGDGSSFSSNFNFEASKKSMMQRSPQRLLLPQKQSFRSIRGLKLSRFEYLRRFGNQKPSKMGPHPRYSLSYKDCLLHQNQWLSGIVHSVYYTMGSSVRVPHSAEKNKWYRRWGILFCTNTQ